MTTYKARFVLFDSAVDDIFTGLLARNLVSRVAEEGAAAARENTPVGFTGDHRDAIYAETGEAVNTVTGPARDASGRFVAGTGIVRKTAAAYFGSKSSTWHLLEYGTADNPAYRPITHAAEGLNGVKYKPSPPNTEL